MTSFEAFFYGISIQESGGRYSALGPRLSSGRAYGKYQIMDFNIPSWTRQAIGRSVSPQEFLNSPSIQEATAKWKLKQYYDKYGARGAASAWYSGNPNLHMSTRPQGAAGPSIKSYVDGVLRHSQGYRGGSSGGGGGVTTPAAPAAAPAPQLSREDLLARFGMTESVLKSDSSLAALFSKAVAGSYSVARFNAELQNTKWFKSHNKVWREAWLLSKTDPATHAQLNLQTRAKVEELMREYGLGTLSNSQWKKVADQLQIESRWQGFNDAQLRKLVVTKIPLLKEGQLYGGKLGAWQTKLMDIAYANGIKLSPGNVGWWTRAIAAGTQTMETAEFDIRKRAANTYTAYKDQILAGQDVMDIASPYIQLASKLLEMPEGKLGLTDGLIKKFMTAKDSKTGAAVATPLWQAEEMIRADNRWMKTNNAQDEMMQTAHKITQEFGLTY